MKIFELLRKETIKIGLCESTKKSIMEELVDILVNTGQVKDKSTVLEALIKREELSSTGLEKGIAIPHCKTDAVNEMLVALALSREGRDFDAADRNPCHIFFLIIAPQGMSGPHVQALAEIAHLSQSSSFLERLKNAQTSEEALDILKDEEINGG